MGTREFEIWRVAQVLTRDYDLRLKIRYREWVEVPAWEDGPDIADALRDAEAVGWTVFDQEPGDGDGVQRIYHLVREATR